MSKLQKIRAHSNAPLYTELRLLGAQFFEDGPPENSDNPDVNKAPDYCTFTDLQTAVVWTRRDNEWHILEPLPPPPLAEYFFFYQPSGNFAQGLICSTTPNNWTPLIIGSLANPGLLQASANNTDTQVSLVSTVAPGNCEFLSTPAANYILTYNINAAQIGTTSEITFAFINWTIPTVDPGSEISQVEYQSEYQMNLGESESTNITGTWEGEVTAGGPYLAGDKYAIFCKTEDGVQPFITINSIEIDVRKVA